MRIYISSDIEGVAGVVTRQHTNPQGFEYEAARRWMTGELNTIINALHDEGVSEVVVSDSHGNGQNILLDNLPKYVRLVRAWPRPLGMMEGIENGPFEGAILHGYHAGASYASGGLAHTLSTAAFVEITINGQSMSEASISAAIAGEFGIPIILISGDDAFVSEVSTIFQCAESVSTKRSLGWFSAETLTHEAACEQLNYSTRRALHTIQDKKCFSVPGPVEVIVEFHYRLAAEVLSYLPWVERSGARRIRYIAENMLQVSRFLNFLTHYKATPE